MQSMDEVQAAVHVLHDSSYRLLQSDVKSLLSSAMDSGSTVLVLVSEPSSTDALLSTAVAEALGLPLSATSGAVTSAVLVRMGAAVQPINGNTWDTIVTVLPGMGPEAVPCVLQGLTQNGLNMIQTFQIGSINSSTVPGLEVAVASRMPDGSSNSRAVAIQYSYRNRTVVVVGYDQGRGI